MSVQKFHGTIATDGIQDGRGIETPSLSATGAVSGQTGVFSESVTAPVFNGKATSAGTADSATNATNDGNGNNIANTYATQTALSNEASARQSADSSLSGQITNIVNGTTTVGQATNATNATTADSAKVLANLTDGGGTVSINGSTVTLANFSQGLYGMTVVIYSSSGGLSFMGVGTIYLDMIGNDSNYLPSSLVVTGDTTYPFMALMPTSTPGQYSVKLFDTSNQQVDLPSTSQVAALRFAQIFFEPSD